MNYVPNQNGKGRNTSKFQFRCCENNIETSILFQNDPPYFSGSTKTCPNSSVILPLTVESITNGPAA